MTLGDHPGAPAAPDLKKIKTITFVHLIFDVLFDMFSHFSGTYFSLIFPTSLLPGFKGKKTPAGLNFESLGVHFFDQFAKIAKSENYDSVRDV